MSCNCQGLIAFGKLPCVVEWKAKTNCQPPASSLPTLRLLLSDHLQQPLPDRVQPPLVLDLVVLLVGHVEDVEDLVEVGGDLRPPDRTAQLEEGPRHGVEQARAIVGEDVDDGVAVRGAVVGVDADLRLGTEHLALLAGLPGAAERGGLAAFRRSDCSTAWLIAAIRSGGGSPA